MQAAPSKTDLSAPHSALPITPAPSDQFPLALAADQQELVAQRLAQSDFVAMPLQQIARLGSEAEQALHDTLNGFLAHIDRFENPRLFNLFENLQGQVDQQDLPALAERILSQQPTLWQRVLGVFNKKALARALAKAWDETRRIASGKMQTLADKVGALEQDLALEQQKLSQEIDRLEQLKEAYRQRFGDFVVGTAFLRALSASAAAQVQAMERAANTADAQQMFTLEEARHKLQALQSRALAVEGTLARLPSDQLVIRQLQNAGLATWQETSTTASARFASIKMTLLTLHGALLTQGVQRMAEQGKALDDSLGAVRAKLMRDVVTTSANQPGENRLAQAQQLQHIVAESRALQGIVLHARQANAQKFEQARSLLAQAQQDMLALGTSVRPDLAPLR